MIDVIRKIYRVLNKKQRRRLFVVLVVTVIGSFAELLSISILLPFIDMLLEPQIIHINKYLSAIYEYLHFHDDTSFFVAAALGIAFVSVLKNLYIVLMNEIQVRFVKNNNRRVACQLMRYYIEQPYLYHSTHNRSEIMRNVAYDTDMFFAALNQTMHVFTEGAVCVVLIIYLIYKDKTITFFMMAALGLFMLLFVKIFKRKLTAYGEESRKCNEKENQCLLQAYGGIREVKLYNKENYFYNQYNQVSTRKHWVGRKVKMYEVIPKPLMESVCMCALLGVIALKIARGVDISYFIPTITVFAYAAVRLMPSVTRITAAISGMTYNRPAVDIIYNTIQEMNGKERGEDEETVPQPLVFKRGIELHRVRYRYPETEEPVLDDVRLYIEKNTSVGLIGPSGGGKTTLADVMIGILDCDDGQVLVDGKDIRENKRGWYKNVGYIPQSIFLTDDTVRNNIAFGLDETEIEDEKVWNALKKAQLEEVVSGLEKGLDTVIGEGGVRLSGGQRQRIGLARALYNDPNVLILDEATSALDNDTERAVMEAVENLSGSKTLIIIAHRLTTIENCDYVYKVENKKVELVRKKETGR